MKYNKRRETIFEGMEGVCVVSNLLHCSARVRDAVFFVPGADFARNPYSLRMTSDRALCRTSSEHWMLYPGGFLHVRADGISEKLNAWDWVREANAYARLMNLNFFRTLRLRKAFYAWLLSARAHAFGRSRLRVGEGLRFQAPYISVLTTGLGELRKALDRLRVTPADLTDGVFAGESLVTTGRKLTEVAVRQTKMAIHLLLDHVHQLCRQLVADLDRAWRHLQREHCPSTYDSPVLGLSRGRVAHQRSRVARCRRLESLLPAFLRLLVGLVLSHAASSLSELLQPLRSRLSSSRAPLLLLELAVEQPTDAAVAGGGEAVGPARPRLFTRPDRAQAEAWVRELVRGAAFVLKMGAESALQPRLEGWAIRQPDTFHSALASERVNANEVSFIHALRDASWSSIEQHTTITTLLTSAMAEDFTSVNIFVEDNAWILNAFHHCGVATSPPSKPPPRLTEVIAELKQVIVWHSQLDVLPSQLCAGLLQVSLAKLRQQLTDSLQRRAAWLLTQVTDAMGNVRTDMRKVMREIPAEFSGGEARLSRWYYRVTGLIRDTWSRFEPVGVALRCLSLLRHARWQEGQGTAALLVQLDSANQQLTEDWSTYLTTLYSRHSALLVGLDQRVPEAHRFHQQALDAAESVRQQADQLPRWSGPSDVIMKALIPGFDTEMEKRLHGLIGQLLEDVTQLTQMMTQLDRVMEDVEEAERVIRLLFHRNVVSRQARRTYRRVSEKVAVWTSLRDLLAIARLWLTNMRNSELRVLLTSEMNAWQERRRHFISDVVAERQSMRFWRDRVEEVRRLVVMMEAVQDEGVGSDNWSPIVGRMRYLMAERERVAEAATLNSHVAGTLMEKHKQEHGETEAVKGDQGREDMHREESDPEEGTVEDEERQEETVGEDKQQETLTRHVSVIYEQVSRTQKSFSAKELVQTMDAKLDAVTFTMQRYIPDFIIANGMLMDDTVYTITDGTNFETEVMFQMAALRAVTDWNLTSAWWRPVLATNERWERAALLVRRLVGLQRYWTRLHHLVATGVADAPSEYEKLSAIFCDLMNRLQREPRLCAHDLCQLLAELRSADSVVSQCLAEAGPSVEKVVRRQERWPDGQGVPDVLAGDMEHQLRIQAEQEGFELHSGQLEWLLALHEQLTQCRVAVVAGEPGSGKSTLLALLRAAKQQILAGSLDDVYMSKGAARIVERVLVGPRSAQQLVSSARLMGTLPMVEEWLIVDHDWTALDEVLSAMTPVVEQNHNLVLILETAKFDQLGPVDRRMPWFSLSPHKVSWRMLACEWFEEVAKSTLYRRELDTLKRLTELLFPDTLVFLSKHRTTLSRGRPTDHLISGHLGCHQMTMFKQLFTTMMASYDTFLIRNTGDTRRVLCRVASFAFIWAFGGALERRHQAKFAEIARRLMAAAELDFPADGCVLDHALDAQADWCRWPVIYGGHVTTSGRRWHVPVPQQGSVASLAVRLLANGVNVLLLGSRGVGKTQLLRHEVEPRFQTVSLDHAPYAATATARRCLEDLCRRVWTPMPRPAIVVDDLHYTTVEPDGAGLQHLLREHCLLNGFRSGVDFEFRSTGVMPVFATAVDTPPASVPERNSLAYVAIDARLQRHCFVLTLSAPDVDLVEAIFSPVVRHGVWKYLPAELASTWELFTHCWMDATCRLFTWLQTALPTSAARPSRAFSLHHAARCVRLTLDSASRLLQVEIKDADDTHGRGASGDRGSSKSGSSRSGSGASSRHRSSREPMWKTSLRVLPESWEYAATSVFQQRLECAIDRSKLGEEINNIIADMRKYMETYEKERDAKDGKHVTDKMQPKTSEDMVSSRGSMVNSLTTAISPSQELKSRKHITMRITLSQEMGTRKAGPFRRSRKASKTTTNVGPPKDVRKHEGEKVPNMGRIEKSQNMAISSSYRISIEETRNMPFSRRRSSGGETYKSFLRSNHFSIATATSLQREKLNRQRFGTIVYHRPKSRYMDFSSFSRKYSRVSKDLSISGGDRHLSQAEFQTGEPDQVPGHQQQQLQQMRQQRGDELDNEEATRLWHTLASCLIQQHSGIAGDAAAGTLESMLDAVMSRFAALHPGRLPGALPSAVLRLMLTLMEALLGGGGCTLLLRGRRTPGLRTAVQLACFVTQQQLVDLRPHVAQSEDADLTVCRCVLTAMFGDRPQCLYVTESSPALQLVHAVVTSRLPLQLLGSDVWKAEAERLGFGPRLRHLEQRGILLKVAGDTITRQLHIVVSCSVSDGAGGSHFPELRLQSLWPSFFRGTVLSLPDWPADDYARVARHYISTLDERLADAPVAKMLVALHLDACINPQQEGINSLSLLYQLCEAFVVSFAQLHRDTICRLERVTQQVRQLEMVRINCAELSEQVAAMQHTVNLLHDERTVRRRRLTEVETHARQVRETGTELVQRQTSVAYRLHEQHELLDQLQPEVDQLRDKLRRAVASVDFAGAFSEMCQFDEPSESVLVVYQCVCVLLGKEPVEWEEVAQLLKTAGLPRVCRLISLDIVTEQQLNRLEQLMPASYREQLRQQLQDQCILTTQLLDWMLQLLTAGCCFRQVALAAAEANQLSEEYVRLQVALIDNRRRDEQLQQLRRSSAEQVHQITEQLQTALRRLRHATRRRDWLSRLKAVLFRPDPAPDGSRAVGLRLSEELDQLLDVSRHLPASAAVLAAAATFRNDGSAETSRLQHWLELLACHQERCTCPEVQLLLPAPNPTQLIGLPEEVHRRLTNCPPWFSRHPLTMDASEFVRRCLLPAWYGELSESAATEDVSRLSMLLLSVVLRRPSTRLIVISDPEAKLEHSLRHFGIQLPTVTEEELLQQMPQRTQTDAAGAGTTSAVHECPENTCQSDKHQQEIVNSPLTGRSVSIADDSAGGISDKISDESQQAMLNRTSMACVEDPTSVDTDLLSSFVTESSHRLVLRHPGDASPLAKRLQCAYRGQQHLVAHLDLSPSDETVSAVIRQLVMRLIRPQVHRNQQTYLDDLRYWTARRSAAQRRLLAEWPELLRLLDQLLQAGRSPIPLPERAASPPAESYGRAAPVERAEPRLQRPQQERPILVPSVVQFRDDQSVTTSLTNVTLAAAPPTEQEHSPESDIAHLSAELKRRRRETRASLEMAQTWRNRLQRLQSSQRSEQRRISLAPKPEAASDSSHLTVEPWSYTTMGSVESAEHLTGKVDGQESSSKAAELTESVVYFVGTHHTPKVSFKMGETEQSGTPGKEDIKLEPSKEKLESTHVATTSDNKPAKPGAASDKRTNRKNSEPDTNDDTGDHQRQGRRRRLGFNVGSLVPDTSGSVGSLLPGRRGSRRRSSSGRRQNAVRQRRRSRRRSSAPTPRGGRPPQLPVREETDADLARSRELSASARRRLSSLRQCESSLLEMVAEVNFLDAEAANCRHQLTQLVEQQAPLQPVVAFFSGLYAAIAALRLQSEHLTLDHFASWLATSLRARAAEKLEYRKSADYFRLLGASDVVPRLLARLPVGRRHGYLLLAALLATGWTDPARLRLLVHGPPSGEGWHQRWLPACPPWASERQWLALGALSRRVPAVGRLVAALRAGQDDGWRDRLASGPDVLDRGGLTAGDWVLIWRALQPSAMPVVVEQLINCVLGPAALLALGELDPDSSRAEMALPQISPCVPAVVYAGVTPRLAEKLSAYVSQLLTLLRHERSSETSELTELHSEHTCAWARYLAHERRLARAHVSLVHGELVEVSRLLSARLAPTARLEALVSSLAERSAPARWVPAGGAAPSRLPQLLQHLLASCRHVQQLIDQTPQLWEGRGEPPLIRLSELPRPADCLPSLRQAAAARLQVPDQQVTVTVVDGQHPAPAGAFNVRLDVRHLHNPQRAQLAQLCIGWRRRPRAKHVLLAVCAVAEPSCEDEPIEAEESELPAQPPPTLRSRASSVVDPTMKKFVEQVRLSVG